MLLEYLPILIMVVLASLFAVGNAGYGNPQDAASVELT